MPLSIWQGAEFPNSELAFTRSNGQVPDIARADAALMYYDKAQGGMMLSCNGGSFVPLVGGSSTEINVQAHGVPADGVTDAAGPLSTLMAEVASDVGLAGSATLTFPAGDYLLAITAPITVPHQIGFLCEDGARFIKVTNANSGVLFNFLGTTTATVSDLTADGTTGASTLAVTDGSLFAAGDKVLIADDTFHVVSLSIGKNEELNEILSISGNTITLQTPLINTYATAENAVLTLVYPVTQGVRGGEYVVPQGGNGGGIGVELGFGNVIEGAVVRGSNSSPGFFVYRCRGTKLVNCQALDGQSKSVSGHGYGFDIAESSYDIAVTGFVARNLRECLVTTYSRRVKIEGCTFEGFYDSGVNTHNALVSDVLIRGCFFANSDPSGLSSAIIVGQATSANGVDRNVTIENNYISGIRVAGILVQAPDAPVTQTSDSVTITGNTIEDVGRDNNNHSAITVTRFSNVVITGNRIDGKSNAAQRYGIQIVFVTGATVQGNRILNLTQTNAAGIRWNDSSGLKILDNDVRNVTTNAYQGQTSTDVTWRGNDSDTTTLSVANVWGADNQIGTGATPFRWFTDSLGEQMRLDDTGFLGVGHTAPTRRVDARGTTNDILSGGIRALNTLNGTAAGGVFTAESASSSGFLGAFPSGYTAQSAFADNVVLGINSDAAQLVFSANAAAQFMSWRVGTLNEVMRLTAAGELRLGDPSSNLARFQVVGRADQVQMRVRGFSTQTTLPFLVETSAASALFAIEGDGKIRTNQAVPATSVTAVTKAMPVYDAAGMLLGYVPIYASFA